MFQSQLKHQQGDFLITMWSGVLFDRLTDFQLVKKFPTFYGTQRFITTFRSAPHLSLSWAISIQPIPPHPTSWRSHLCLGLISELFPLGFPTKTLYMPLFSSIHATCPTYLILLNFITRTIVGEEYRSLSSSLYSFLYSHYLIPLRPKYSPQYHQPTFLPQCKWPSWTSIQNDRKITFLYILPFK